MQKIIVLVLALSAIQAEAASWTCRATQRNHRNQEIGVVGKPAKTRAGALANARKACSSVIMKQGFCRTGACYFHPER